MDEGVDRSACVEVVVFTALQEAQLQLAIELVDDRLPSISQFNNRNGHATETAHYIHTSTHCADLSILHSQDKYNVTSPSLGYVSNLLSCQDLGGLGAGDQSVQGGPSRNVDLACLTIFFCKKGLLCKTQFSAKKHFVAFFTHFNCP